MPEYKITWMPGDGVGKEALEATRMVLDALAFDAEYIEAEIGWTCWEKYKDALPPKTIEALENSDCAMLGAITSVPFVEGYKSPVLRMRQHFDLYAAIRTIKAFKGNPLNLNDATDLVIFRENTEGLYKGIEFETMPDQLKSLAKKDSAYAALSDLPDDTTIALRIITPKGCKRIIRAAFEYAKKHNRKKVTCIHKANVLRVTDGLFLKTFNEVAANYPEISIDEQNVDAAAMRMIKEPASYDVIVTTNLFGDILSDEAAQLGGGLGFAPSANIGETMAFFEPSHGSAPKYEGKGIINPIASILAAQMMLEWLGEGQKAKNIENAVAKVIKEGQVRTRDMGGNASTKAMTQAIVDNL